MKLLLTQKNDIFDFILDEGFSPKDFTFIEELLTKNEIVTYLKYKDSNYYFMFRNFGVSSFGTQYSPGESSLEFEESVRGGWKQFSSRVKRWLRNLKRETNSLDKWEALKKGLQILPFAIDKDNTNENFSLEELKIIDFKIQTIKQEINKLDLPMETINQINIKLDILNDKADKFSKTDWKELFIGAIIGVIFNLAIPQDTANAIWEIIRQIFKHYILPGQLYHLE